MPKTAKINVRIPAGVDTGSRLRSVGNGEAGVAGGGPGDLYIVLSVRDHELFERQGDDLFCEIPIKFTLATLGGNIEVPTLFGKASLKLPAGTQSGTTFRLRGKGMPSLRNRGDQGDQLVRVHVEVPQSLNSEQRKLLEQFALVVSKLGGHGDLHHDELVAPAGAGDGTAPSPAIAQPALGAGRGGEPPPGVTLSGCMPR